MAVSEQAGKPAEPSMLVDVERLIDAYYDIKPDPGVPAQHVAFGTSGHRGSSLNGSFNENHILATTEAICRYRHSRGIDGPLFIGKDSHALSEPGDPLRRRSPGRQRRLRPGRQRRRPDADARRSRTPS